MLCEVPWKLQQGCARQPPRWGCNCTWGVALVEQLAVPAYTSVRYHLAWILVQQIAALLLAAAAQMWQVTSTAVVTGSIGRGILRCSMAMWLHLCNSTVLSAMTLHACNHMAVRLPDDMLLSIAFYLPPSHSHAGFWCSQLGLAVLP